ncbi:MAG TPA: hypothetical protein VMA35_04440 [Candidatus Sulfopaludibacter sp.]|nr:hypothetical protein [Candidatus Sulfopaludibacter sp.]
MKVRRELETFEQAVEKARRALKSSWLKGESTEGEVRMEKKNIEPFHVKRAKHDPKSKSI